MKIDWLGVTVIGGSIIVGVGLTVAITLEIISEANEPATGTIVELVHDPSYTMSQCQGDPVICVPITYPECWRVEYVNDGNPGDACVNPRSWLNYEVGDTYP